MSAHRRRPEISSVHPRGKEKYISTWLTSQLRVVCKVRRGLAFLSVLLINCVSVIGQRQFTELLRRLVQGLEGPGL